MRLRLRPGLTIATLIGLSALVSLGVWQLRRLEWKRGLIAQVEARLAAPPIAFDEAVAREGAGESLEYQPVFLDGVYANDLESSVFGTYEGAAGVYVFTPLDAANPASGGRRFVYVDRGFAPQAFRDPSTRSDAEVKGKVRVEGLFRRTERRRGFEKWLAPEDQTADNLYFTRDPEILAARHQLTVPPFYIDSFGRESGGSWPKGGLTRVEFPNRHLEYALTWFGLAAALLGVFLTYSVKGGGQTKP